MTDIYSKTFILALKEQDMEKVKQIPKADLHNHFVLGGSRKYILEKTGYDIRSFTGVLHSMDDMHKWNEQNIGARFDNRKMRELLIEATFVQAKEDGVTVLEIGEDVWALNEYFNQDVEELIYAFTKANEELAPEVELRLQIGMSRHCGVDYLMECLQPFWGRKEFYSIDLYGDELAQPIENFIPIYRKAKECGLRLKAHIGEWGSAEDVKNGVELLELDEVQHGIAAAESIEVMEYLKQNKIRLNITPTSNVKLGRAKSIKEHPIKTLFQAGIDITVNSDDILIFDSDVSKEFMRLYKEGTLSAEELDSIRRNGLRKR
jgi:adenosine deaminase